MEQPHKPIYKMRRIWHRISLAPFIRLSILLVSPLDLSRRWLWAILPKSKLVHWAILSSNLFKLNTSNGLPKMMEIIWSFNTLFDRIEYKIWMELCFLDWWHYLYCTSYILLDIWNGWSATMERNYNKRNGYQSNQWSLIDLTESYIRCGTLFIFETGENRLYTVGIKNDHLRRF